MKHRIETDSEQDLAQYKQLLEQSTNNLSPNIKARLDISRRDALQSIASKSSFMSSLWRPALALVVPMFAIVLFLFAPAIEEDQQATTDIYTDLELLLDNEQLDFLADMEVSEWIVSENGG